VAGAKAKCFLAISRLSLQAGPHDRLRCSRLYEKGAPALNAEAPKPCKAMKSYASVVQDVLNAQTGQAVPPILNCPAKS